MSRCVCFLQGSQQRFQTCMLVLLASGTVRRTVPDKASCHSVNTCQAHSVVHSVHSVVHSSQCEHLPMHSQWLCIDVVQAARADTVVELQGLMNAIGYSP